MSEERRGGGKGNGKESSWLHREVRRTLLGFDLLIPPTLTTGSGSLPSWTYEGRAELLVEPTSIRGEREGTMRAHLLIYRTITPMVSGSYLSHILTSLVNSLVG